MSHPELADKAVLIADEEHVMARDLAAALRRHGARVVGPVRSVSDAFRLARTEDLHGAVLDISLLEDPVFPIADELLRRGVPFVFATGYARPTVPPQHLGRILFRKPYRPSEVIAGLVGRAGRDDRPGQKDPPPRNLKLWNARVSAVRADLARRAGEGADVSRLNELLGRMLEAPGDLALTVQSACVRNAILRSLPPATFGLLQPDLEPVALERSARLEDGRCYFVEAGAVSAFVAEPRGIDAGPIGREGMVGLDRLGAGGEPVYRYIVRLEGDALSIPAEALRRAYLGCADLARFLAEFAMAQAAHLARVAQAQARSSVEARLARYLLALHTRTGGLELVLTHDALAEGIGVRRASVTDAMHKLEGAGALRNCRGAIILRDPPLLRRILAGAGEAVRSGVPRT